MSTNKTSGNLWRPGTSGGHRDAKIDRAVAPRPESAGLVGCGLSSARRAAAFTVVSRPVRRPSLGAPESPKPSAGAGVLTASDAKGRAPLLIPLAKPKPGTPMVRSRQPLLPGHHL